VFLVAATAEAAAAASAAYEETSGVVIGFITSSICSKNQLRSACIMPCGKLQPMIRNYPVSRAQSILATVTQLISSQRLLTATNSLP